MLALSPGGASGQSPDFATEVFPLLQEHCTSCHGAGLHRAQLRLDARAIALKGGVSGRAIVPGDHASSLLFQRIAGLGGQPRMPEDGPPLDEAAIALIARWIDGGAAWPEGVGSDASSVPVHWAYVAPQRPAVTDPDPPGSAIDFFIRAELSRHGLDLSPPADPALWLRRVALDLTGLPTSLEEVDAFLADPSPSARAGVVERLLGSPRFGEQWARHWLDLARYADSTGYHDDEIRATWPYRDWVIRAINDDLPFDRFTIEQLAGDLLPEPSRAQLIATGFHRAAPCNLESGVPAEESRVAQVFDRVHTTATVWLATTLECAQCHNHKHDPFSQREYYQLFAYFNQTVGEVGGAVGPGRNAMAGAILELDDGSSTFIMEELTQTRATHIFLRGDYTQRGEPVGPATPRALHALDPALPKNRLGLARWIVDPANPLTARVAVNHWWAELFGSGLVRTAEDFGTLGEAPSHPELLDWLATELVSSGWSRKHILRTIVLSETYGQSARVSPRLAELDPGNRLLGRSPRPRLPAETIRDSALAIAGLLSPRLGGAPSYPPQPEGLWWIRDDKSPRYLSSEGEERYRRGIYTIWRRLNLHPTLSLFDAPSRTSCSTARPRTNTPLQALALLNGPVHLEAAFAFAARIMEEWPDAPPEVRASFAFRIALARHPSDAQAARLAGLYRHELARFRSEPESADALLDAARGPLAVPDGVDPAELAAWFHVASVLLNLDETVSRP